MFPVLGFSKKSVTSARKVILKHGSRSVYFCPIIDREESL
jgi:hypothetical protein